MGTRLLDKMAVMNVYTDELARDIFSKEFEEELFYLKFRQKLYTTTLIVYIFDIKLETTICTGWVHDVI